MDILNVKDKLTILLVTADPSNATKLRLEDELEEIQKKLQHSKCRDKFHLEMRQSVRPGDLTQAVIDTRPQIVHFSCHGTQAGEICLQNDLGEVHVVSPDALASLFKLIARQVRGVVLNACFTKPQAQAIAQHIDYVIGMDGRIEDSAAITFSAEFYKALCANYSIEKAYNFGLVELELEGIKIPEDLKPILIKKKNDWEINIIFPEGFSMDRNSFSEFPEWLRDPIGRGLGVTEHSLEGVVTPQNRAAAVEIKMRTDRWHPQSLCPIQEDGTFSGSVWFHHSLPSATIRFDILDGDRKLLKRFDVNIS